MRNSQHWIHTIYYFCNPEFYNGKMAENKELKIVVDLGNTLVKVAVFEGLALLSLKTFRTGAFHRLSKYLLSMISGSYCIVSSVVDFPFTLEKVLTDHFRTLFFDTQTAIPIINLYKTPETLGKDRIAAAVGAWNHFPERDLLVIDAGTAVTMDYVSASGEFYGGAISPGINMRYKALNTFTGKLPLVEKQNITYLTGTTTEESISSGVINGIVAEIDGVIERYRTIHPGLIVVFGGGDSKFLHKRLKNSIFALPNPVLEGLHIILNYNIENNRFT